MPRRKYDVCAIEKDVSGRRRATWLDTISFILGRFERILRNLEMAQEE